MVTACALVIVAAEGMIVTAAFDVPTGTVTMTVDDWMCRCRYSYRRCWRIGGNESVGSGRQRVSWNRDGSRARTESSGDGDIGAAGEDDDPAGWVPLEPRPRPR